MLIALVGPACSGKYEVAKYLIVHHHFRPAFLGRSSSYQQHVDELLQLCNSSSDQAEQPHDFASVQALLEHSTAHWRDNIVTLDLKTRAEIEIGFDKRPFFLLIGVDAPVTVRWRREVKRCVCMQICIECNVKLMPLSLQTRNRPDCVAGGLCHCR
jgi:dCMP deaminase